MPEISDNNGRRPATDQTATSWNGQFKNRLNSRLCYLLRYGALKEGMQVDEKGFVRLSELLENRLMRHHGEDEVLQEIETSHSKRGPLRFEKKIKDGIIYVRSRFSRRFESNPYHPGTKVPTLLESNIQFICDNIEQYDLQDFPDEYLIHSILHRLKRQKKLTGNILRSLLSPTLEHLNLERVYLTEGLVKAVCRTCQSLRVLSFMDCGYVINDNLIEYAVRKLPHLESLNLAACSHLTDRSLRALCKHCPKLKHLNVSKVRGISEASVIELIERAPNLEHLDIFDHRISEDGRQKILELASKRGLIVVLRWLNDPTVAPPDPCTFLPNFGKVW